MIKITTFLFFILLPFLVLAQGKQAELSQPLVFTHVTILDVVGGSLKSDMTVVIMGNKISTIQKSRNAKWPKGATVVDATGKFLLPGLWNMHAHSGNSQTARRIIFPLNIANGVTGIRDLFSDCYQPPCLGGGTFSFDSLRTFRNEIEACKLVGPRIVGSSPLIDGPKPSYPGSFPVANAAQGRQAVLYSKKKGVDFVKVYNGIPREGYFAIVEEAKNQGIPFAGHVPESVTVEEASNAGQKSIEHLTHLTLACSSLEDQIRQERRDTITVKRGTPGWWARYFKHHQLILDTYDENKENALFNLLHKNGTWQCPTLTVLRSLGNMEL